MDGWMDGWMEGTNGEAGKPPTGPTGGSPKGENRVGRGKVVRMTWKKGFKEAAPYHKNTAPIRVKEIPAMTAELVIVVKVL